MQIVDFNFQPINVSSRKKYSFYYQFVKKNKIGINIFPEYYSILLIFSNKNISSYLGYLYKKYHKQIIALKISHYKRTATAEYQPKTKNYKKYVLTQINPYIWEKYWDLRRITGYSISFIIRIFLEWELEEKNRNEDIKNGEPILKKIISIEIPPSNFHDFYFINSYFYFKHGNSERGDIFIYFKDIFW